MLSDRTEIALRVWAVAHQLNAAKHNCLECVRDCFRKADEFIEASVVKCPSCYPPEAVAGIVCAGCNAELCSGHDPRPEVRHRVSLVAGKLNGKYMCNICLIGRGTR